MIAGGIIFIMPGLCKKNSDFPLHRITLIIVYMIFMFVYPFLLVAAAQEPKKST